MLSSRALCALVLALMQGLMACARHETTVPLTQVVHAAVATHGVFPDETVSVASTIRHYRLAVPSSVDLASPAPLVIAFHGMLIDNKDVMPQYTGFDATAQRHGFIAAYPNAVDGSWGLWPHKIEADLTFFDALLERLSAEYRVDPDRIYALGMSNGGYFVHLLGKERSTLLAAIASHSGPLGLQTLGGVKAARKFPVLIVHGTQDWIFPVAFARENVQKYRNEGHQVQYIEVPGLGHEWATEASINERIWSFFSSHSRSSIP